MKAHEIANKEELIKALRNCGSTIGDCGLCFYKNHPVCHFQMAIDAADALEAAERLLDLNTKRCEALRKQLRESHESYEKHLNELEAQMPKWTSVKNQLPEESKEYVVYIQMGTDVEVPDWLGNGDLSYVTSMYFKKEQKLWFDEYDEPYNADLSLVDTANDYHVTHWMPFPLKPKGEHDD